MTETGDHALRQAMRLTRGMPGSELHVTYVVRAEKGVHDAAKLDALSDQISQTFDQLRGHVTTTCAPSSSEGAFTQELVFHVRLGQPAEAIHQVAVDVDADLIVVGTHGRKGVEKLILGSVAEELVRTSRAPVLVARPKDFEGLEHSAKVEPARPGEDLHSGLSRRVSIDFHPRTSHISGLL